MMEQGRMGEEVQEGRGHAVCLGLLNEVDIRNLAT